MYEQSNSGRASAWEYEPLRDQFYYHAFSKDAPDLNLRNEAVLQQLDVSARNLIAFPIFSRSWGLIVTLLFVNLMCTFSRLISGLPVSFWCAHHLTNMLLLLLMMMITIIRSARLMANPDRIFL